jgi:hypothetical protein
MTSNLAARPAAQPSTRRTSEFRLAKAITCLLAWLRCQNYCENCWTALGMNPKVLINASVAMPYPMARAAIASPLPRSSLSWI